MIDRTARPIYLLLAAASLFIIMFGIKATAVIINPILLALIITIAVLPLPGMMAKRGMSHKVALVLTILIVVGVIVFVMLLFGYGLYSLAQDLPTYAEDIAARSEEFAAWYEDTTSEEAATVDAEQVNVLAGIILGPFVGAVVAELSGGRKLQDAGRAGMGAWIGTVIGAAAKLALAFLMVGIFVFKQFF